MNLVDQFLLPLPVLKHGAGASSMTRKRHMLLDDLGGGRGRAPRAPRPTYNPSKRLILPIA
jgi:hypothetical protein